MIAQPFGALRNLMRFRLVSWVPVAIAIFLGLSPFDTRVLRAESPISPPDGPGKSADQTVMSERIDRHIEQSLTSQRIAPTPLCDDATFLRRVSLDLTGIVPTPAELRQFVADPRPDKRAAAVERCLNSPRHPTHLATTWRRILLPGQNDPQQLQSAAELHQWLYRQFARELRYDRLVAEFLSATGEEQAGPALFYQSLEAKPEKLAAATSRVFLGLQIQCAECHDHPFDAWTQRDFWGYAAFFAQLQPLDAAMADRYRLVDLPAGEVTLPETDHVVAPRFPAGTNPLDASFGTRRRQLAIWMASGDNPYLAPAAVNRVWSQMFGYGLVHPVDDFGPHNPATYPELLAELSEFFVRTEFDLATLYRTLANTRAYQRQSRQVPLRDDEAKLAPEQGTAERRARLLAQMPVRRLTADQLYDSLTRSLGIAAAGPASAERNQFVSLMESNARDVIEYDLGLQQALRIMNGQEVTAGTGPQADANPDGGILAALAAPFWDDRQRLDIVFLASLSRFPTPAEQAACLALLAQTHPARPHSALGVNDGQVANAADAPAADAREETRERSQEPGSPPVGAFSGNANEPDDTVGSDTVWGDIVWALLNSAEFQTNH